MPRNIYFIFFIVQFCITFINSQDAKNIIINKRKAHKHIEVADEVLSKVSDLNDLDYFNTILDNILIPRVVGTEDHEKVKDYIVDEMKQMNWNIELDVFKDKTPNLGELTFSNIIAKLNPKAERFLTIACHYDSKYFPNQVFLGATDSAVPCAMMLNLAKTMAEQFDSIKDNDDLSVMFIFFDGEEAFLEWSSVDSIYGARHLAAKWEKEDFLHKIDVLMLLDLLGAPDPTFYSINQESSNWYSRLRTAEHRLSHKNLLKKYTTSGISSHSSNIMFNQLSFQAGIEDDHIPFMRRNVPILHLIPVPFPDVWHKIEDDRKAIDLATIENLMKIFRIFIIEYLHIELN
ncbi:hypothetical protein PVAND_004491 [Polypedilum vanderplanki]|uniref:Glutaminyl-peptide cyclotransferase n=1 Tax=Polypedilum vanderplanki TaxID=319348 RepID=A0A9J6BX49_POLVA|nr:hypothetical protein PVAND_004491 [Polypedilum vanderplanki]